MRIVAVMGSYRKGKTIDTLVEQAIEGSAEANRRAEIDKIMLID